MWWFIITGEGGLKRKLGSSLTDSGPPLSTTSESRDRDEGDRTDDGNDPACRLGWGAAKPEEVGGAATEQRTSDRYNQGAHPSHRVRTGVAWASDGGRHETDQRPTT